MVKSQDKKVNFQLLQMPKNVSKFGLLTAALAAFGLLILPFVSLAAGNPPTVITLQATNVGANSATISGQFNGNGYLTTYWFEYGTSVSLGFTTASQNSSSSPANIPVSENLVNLAPNTTYYFRLVATNQFGATQGQILNFATAVPTLAIVPANATVASGAGIQLRAMYDPDGPAGPQPQYDVTNSTSWSSSNYSIANVSAGYVTGILNGSATVTGAYANLTAAASITVTGGAQGSVPAAQTNSATNINYNSATLNGNVNPNNAQTTYWFEYGTSVSLGSVIGSQAIGSGGNSQNVSYSLSGLNQNSTYYYRVAAQNQYGTIQGQTLSFSTNNGGGNSMPIATTNYVSNLTLNSATLNGTVNSNGSNANYWFEYGQTSALGQTVGYQFFGNYFGPQNVSAPIYNLIPNMNYYYRVAAQNSYGTAYGSIYNFTTMNSGGGYSGGGAYNCNVGNYTNGYNNYYGYNGNYNYNYNYNSAPCVQTLAPTGIGDAGATFNGQVTASNNNYDSVMGWFEYGPNSSSLTYTTNNSYIPSSAYNYNFSNAGTNLVANTTYYVRAVARNSYGTSYGQTYQFTTTGGGGSYNYYGGGSGVPVAVTRAAAQISRNSVLLNGSANPNGGLGTSWFEYGTTYSLGQKTDSLPVGSGNSSIDTAFALSGLLPATAYYFRAAVQTPAGTGYGSILNFQTAGTISSASASSASSAPSSGGGNTAPEGIVNIGNSSCFQISPVLNQPEVNPGDEFGYNLTYKNNCGYDLSNVSLKIALPAETTFVSANGVFTNRDYNTLNYNLGVIANGSQGSIEVKNKANGNVGRGSTLLYGATANWNGKKGAFYTSSAYISVLVGAAAAGSGQASLLSVFSGWGWLWLLLLLPLALAAYWMFSRKEEKSAVQKIEQSIS